MKSDNFIFPTFLKTPDVATNTVVCCKVGYASVEVNVIVLFEQLLISGPGEIFNNRESG